MEGDCTHNPEDWNNKIINESAWRLLGPPRSIDKTTLIIRVRKMAKIRHRYNHPPPLTQDTNGKVTTSQLGITNESQEVSPFPAGDHKASITRRAQKDDKNKTEIT